jgi:hypothetical protein
MTPPGVLAFALIIGYFILTMIFSFTISFHIGLLIGAVSYIFYEILGFLWPFIRMGASFFRIMKIMIIIFILFLIFKMLFSSGDKKRKERRN